MISIAIPVYNEAGIVREAALELCRKLDALGWDYELILSENGSRDGTRGIIEQLASENPRIRALTGDEPNYGRALKKAILEARGSEVICDEIDLCDVEFYQRALPLLARGADLIVGSKAMKGANDARPFIRRFATRVITLLLRLATGFRGTDTHGLKAFQRATLLPTVEACVIDRDLFASEFVIRAARAGVRVLEIPVRLAEKRPPSIHLLKRVPNTLRGMAKLTYVIRFGGKP